MLVKLAMYNEKKQEKEISLCCNLNNSEFFPITKNIFGIINNDVSHLSYGEESSQSGAGIYNKMFVNIFQCVLEKEKSRFNKYPTPYEGLILDNQFFLNLILFCKENLIKIQTVDFTSQFETDLRISEETGIEKIIEEVKENSNIKINKIVISKEKFAAMFSNLGYIEISSEPSYFHTNLTFFQNLIKKGFEDNGVF
jgi:hypothetical protein